MKLNTQIKIHKLNIFVRFQIL